MLSLRLLVAARPFILKAGPSLASFPLAILDFACGVAQPFAAVFASRQSDTNPKPNLTTLKPYSLAGARERYGNTSMCEPAMGRRGSQGRQRGGILQKKRRHNNVLVGEAKRLCVFANLMGTADYLKKLNKSGSVPQMCTTCCHKVGPSMELVL
jgi:hypothetical protein